MPPIRYVLAFFSGCLILAGGVAFCASVRQSFIEDFREDLRKEKAAGTLPPELEDVDIETITPDGFDLEVSEGQIFKLSLADFITEFWFIWVFVIFGACFGIAYLLGKTPTPQQ
ncbi:MAG: hypothetical protein IID46_09900 [Planctomycetes bacterium]|nr:hypothetical protein [Planctomycetota bacterium]